MMHPSSWRQWILDQMARKGWETQSELARAADIPQSAISQWLDPKRRRQQVPTVANARKVAGAFGLPKLRGLVAAGIIPPEDLEEVGLKPDSDGGLSWEDISFEQHLREIRLKFQNLEKENEALRKGVELDHWSHGEVPGVPLAGSELPPTPIKRGNRPATT